MSEPPSSKAVLPGGAVVHQSPGRETTTDTLLLGLWADPPEDALVCELGCGSAAASAVAALRHPGRSWVCVDRDGGELVLARRNLELAGCSAGVLCCDVARVPAALSAGSADLVIMNPPYRESGSGRRSPKPGRAASRHGDALCVPQFVRAAEHLLAAGGRLLMVGMAAALPGMILAVRAYGLSASLIQPVGASNAPAALTLLEARRSGGELKLLPARSAEELISLLLRRER